MAINSESDAHAGLFYNEQRAVHLKVSNDPKLETWRAADNQGIRKHIILSKKACLLLTTSVT